MTLIREIDLGAEALRVCMCQATVCVGFREEYRIFKNVVGGPVAESVLFAIKNTPPNARPRPSPAGIRGCGAVTCHAAREACQGSRHAA